MTDSADLYHELFRPQFHFSAPKGWINDPNGLIYYNEDYHLFYQHNPDDIVWGNMTWGHAISKDLVKWDVLPDAITPDSLGTIFSGTVVVDRYDTSHFFNGSSGLVAIFTQHGDHEVQSIAYSKNSGRTWEKYAHNPVIPNPGGISAKDFRDPKVFWHEPSQKWIMVLGGGFFRFYQSNNLREFIHIETTGLYEEMPDLFNLKVNGNPEKEKWILSLCGYGYFIGDFDGNSFYSESNYLKVDYGESWQAALSFNNLPNDRRVWMAWMRDSNRAPTHPWRGNLSVSRELSLHEINGEIRLCQAPVHELHTLRKELFTVENYQLMPLNNPLASLKAEIYEMMVELTLSQLISFGFRFRVGKDQETVFSYCPKIKGFFLDTTRSSAFDLRSKQTSLENEFYSPDDPEPFRIKGRSYFAPFMINLHKKLKIHILVDTSTIEIFTGQGEVVFTSNIYPSEDSCGIEMFASSDGVYINSCRIYNLRSIWE